MLRRWVGVVCFALLVLPSGVQAAAVRTTSTPSTRSAATALADLEQRMLTTRPTVGPTWVVSIAGESTSRTLVARTLQGIVNRTEARVYLIDGGDPAAQTVFNRYLARGLVTQAGTTNLDGMLDLFATEASGYVLADVAEPWSVHGASVIATLQGAVVATDGEVAALQARGLTEVDDTRGRWPDALSAYEDLFDTYGDQLASNTVAVVNPNDTLWDFVAQQELLPLFVRPSDAIWNDVLALFDQIPEGAPVYGYLSSTGEEEAVAVAALAATDLVLVPTDTTRNLSYHVAVGADLPRARIEAPDLSGLESCTSDVLNVTVGLTDGDNMNVPLNHFMRATNWESPRRGDLPLGWSIGPDLAVLAPAAWDTYVLEATERDELVGVIGWGYTAPALLSDPDEFYRTSFELMEALGMTTFWSLGGGLDTATSPYWGDLEGAAGDGIPDGVLVGYGNAVGSAFYSPAGRPAFTSRSVYSETPAQLAAHLDALLATDPADRPLVSFLSATNWSNHAEPLIDALAPFEAQGVRFLTPAEAAACMPPPAPPSAGPVAGPGSCLPEPPFTQTGFELISEPAAAELGRVPTELDVPTTITATESVPAGGRIDYAATIEVDLPAFAEEVLSERVQPVIEAGYGPELAESAWLDLRFTDAVLRFPLADGTTAVGTPTVASTGPGAVAGWGDNGLEVRIASMSEETRNPGTSFELQVQWSATAATRAEAFDAVVRAGERTFDLWLVIGVQLGTIALQGGVRAPWTCTAGVDVLASTRVGAAPTAAPAPLLTNPVSPGISPAATAVVGAPSYTG